jgi:hypothetical protein
VPHDPDTAGFLGRLARQLALLAGRRARDPAVMRALTELAALLAGTLAESLDLPGSETI